MFNETLISIIVTIYTNTFVADVLLEKFGHNEEYKQLPTIISRWLSGTVDREGGRKTRKRSVEQEVSL